MIGIISTVIFSLCPSLRLIALTLAVASTVAAAANVEKRSFHLEAGDAAATLPQFITQSGEEIMYMVSRVQGVRTHAVNGKYLPREALDLMLAQTGLAPIRDAQSGAVMITRVPSEQASPSATPLPSPKPTSPPKDSMKSRTLIAILSGWLGLSGQPRAAELPTPSPGGSAALAGRILNVANGEYLRNAEVRVDGTPILGISEDGGYYRLSNLPAGEIMVLVSYPGLETIRTTVLIRPGANTTRDFEFGSAGADRSRGATVKLDAFMVSAERDGQAKAIAEQKNAMNVKTVVASDNFGDTFEGNIGEFLKYMSGVTLDYVETDTRSARLGGLEAQYGYVTLDGGTMASVNSLANGFRADSRGVEFEGISIDNIESIEVNKTLSADMPADAPAGTINLKTKSALDRKGQRFSYTIGLIGNQYEFTLRETPRPDDAPHRKIRPTAKFDYSNVFLGDKLGVAFNGAFTNVFKESFRETMAFDYTSAAVIAAGHPAVSTITYKDGSKITEKSSGGLKVDYQPFPALRLSLVSNFTYFVDEMGQKQMQFAGTRDPRSSMTEMIMIPSGANATTRLATGLKYSAKKTDTTNLSLGFTYKEGRWNVDGLTSYSRARFQNGGIHRGTVDSAQTQLTRVAFTATRPAVDSTAWNFTQTFGPSWYDFSNYGRSDALAGNIDSQNSVAKTEQFVGQFNAKFVTAWEIPTFFKAGLYEQVTTRGRIYNKDLYTYTYVGPANNQLSAPLPASIAEMRISQPWGGNLGSLPFADRHEVRDLLDHHPEYFSTTEAQRASDLDIMLGAPQSNQEQIGALYLMQNSRVGKWQLQGGVRWEDTRTISSVKRLVPAKDNPFARVTTNATTGAKTYAAVSTIDYVTYKWSQGFATDYGSYDNLLPSLSAKYGLARNLDLKLGYNQAIKRPPLNFIAGQWTIDSSNAIITIPNPSLTPERSEKYSAMVEYYFQPAGTVGVHVFETKLKGASDQLGPLSAADVGLANDPTYGNYEFITFINVPGIRIIKGIELNYSQQLVFLPFEVLRGLSVFASYSRYSSHDRPPAFIPQNATGGLSWRYRRVNAMISGTWRDESLTGANGVAATARYFPSDPEYLDARLMFDATAGYQLSRHLSLFVSGRNIFNSGQTWHYKSDNRIRQTELYGAEWTFGVRGDF